MKARSIALAAHQAGETTNLARCWRFERRDGVVITVTDHDADIEVNGEIYRAQDGMSPTSIAQEASAAVANSEANGFLTPEGVTEDDVLSGVWDGAFVTVFEVNYTDVGMGVMILQSGNIGDIKTGRNNVNAEVRGVTQSLQKVVGRVYTKGCPWKFGDPDTCRFNVEALRVTGALTAVESRREFSDVARVEVADYFGAGVLTMTSGENEGFSMEVYWFGTGTFVLHLPLPFNVAVGDTYSVIPGCRKRYTEDCRTKWANTNNFGGFDLVPGADKILGLGGTEGTNL